LFFFRKGGKATGGKREAAHRQERARVSLKKKVAFRASIEEKRRKKKPLKGEPLVRKSKDGVKNKIWGSVEEKKKNNITSQADQKKREIGRESISQ